ncbi:MAG: helix-turn-helix domain-containing protein [Patescibacteria group bacterium]
MTAFIPKKIDQAGIWGEKLSQARKLKQLKIEDIAKKINIRPEYLLAIEEERFDKLPAGLYGKNFIKEYAAALGLNVKEILRDWDEQVLNNSPEDPFSRKILARHKFIIFPKLVRNLLFIGAIIICFLYLIFYFKKIILPPQLTITQPSSNLSIKGTNIMISGQTESEAEIKINGEIVLNNNNGNFSQTINLKKGLNNIIIKAKKKYSREEIVTRQILVE